MVGVFLALLELIREKKILVEQAETLGDVEITPAPEEHRRTYVGASLHLAGEKEEAAAEADSGGDAAPAEAAEPAIDV